MAFRLYYLDDSGDPSKGIAVYSWVEVDAAQWADALDAWLGFREKLFQEFAIPPDYEIHSTKFLPGRGSPSLEESWNKSKHARQEVFRRALSAIGSLPGVSVGAVFQCANSRRYAFAQVTRQLYGDLVCRIDTRLTLAGDQGAIILDGDGTDPSYQEMQRSLQLTRRHLIEDPSFRPAHASEWIQIADIVAYTAYQGIVRKPGREFIWDWYREYLDPDGPQLI